MFETPTTVTVSSEALSTRLWDLDWSAHTPWLLEGDVTFEVATADAILEFVRASYADIFALDPKDDRFLPDPMTPAKRRFLELSDRFVFRDGGETIGVLVGQPVDWSTYYWRTVAFLPEHQGRGLLAAALEHTDEVMRAAGVQRVEGETAPVNYRQVRLLHRLGYCVTGSTNSERFGTLLRLTKFLVEEGQEKFTSRFCRDSLPRRRDSGIHLKQEGGRHEEVRHRQLLSPIRVPSPEVRAGGSGR